MEKLGAPALLLSGEGTLTAQNGLGLFAYEQYRTACLTLRGGTLRIPAGLEDGLYMGNASGADDLFLAQGELVINGGTVTLNAVCLENGSITLNGGTLILPDGRESAVTENGSLIQNGGEIR